MTTQTKIDDLMRRVRSSLTPSKLDDDVAQAFESLQAENERLRDELDEWRFTNRVDELEREVNRLLADAALWRAITSRLNRRMSPVSPTWTIIETYPMSGNESRPDWMAALRADAAMKGTP